MPIKAFIQIREQLALDNDFLSVRHCERIESFFKVVFKHNWKK
jgi:hypothetical protein